MKRTKQAELKYLFTTKMAKLFHIDLDVSIPLVTEKGKTIGSRLLVTAKINNNHGFTDCIKQILKHTCVKLHIDI